MRESDLPAAEYASGVTFLEGDRRSRRACESEPEQRTATESAQWIARMSHFLATDPDGCWVAVQDGPVRGDGVPDGSVLGDSVPGDGGARVVGFALSQNRGPLWLLITYGVLPGFQGKGIGKRLMAAVLAHGGDRQGMFISTVHPGATRRYWRAGFSLQPLMSLSGTVDRAALPAVTGLREGTEDDLGWMDLLDADLRGAGHGPDHPYMRESLRLIVSRDIAKNPGYAYTDHHGRAVLLAAQRPDTAQQLLWEVLASAPDGKASVPPAVTAANQWALEVGFAARLDLGQDGYLALRGMATPAPYLPSGRFL